MIVFFFASAGVSAAYLTVSEVFPMETRALCIAVFYAIGTGVGRITGPLVFSVRGQRGRSPFNRGRHSLLAASILAT